jgi:hypothetical protein
MRVWCDTRFQVLLACPKQSQEKQPTFIKRIDQPRRGCDNLGLVGLYANGIDGDRGSHALDFRDACVAFGISAEAAADLIIGNIP